MRSHNFQFVPHTSPSFMRFQSPHIRLHPPVLGSFVKSVEEQLWAPEDSSSSSPFSSVFPVLLVVIPIIVVPTVLLILIPAVEPLHGV